MAPRTDNARDNIVQNKMLFGYDCRKPWVRTNHVFDAWWWQRKGLQNTNSNDMSWLLEVIERNLIHVWEYRSKWPTKLSRESVMTYEQKQWERRRPRTDNTYTCSRPQCISNGRFRDDCDVFWESGLGVLIKQRDWLKPENNLNFHKFKQDLPEVKGKWFLVRHIPNKCLQSLFAPRFSL